MKSQLAIIVPCYNEEAVLDTTAAQLGPLLEEMITSELIRSDSYILFVNDGSRDRTWSIIEQLHLQNPQFKGVNMSRNYGHQNALMAGFEHCLEVDITITIDADLQDDIQVIPQMVTKWNEGNHIVYGVRNDRTTDSSFKKLTANGFYKLLSYIGVESIPNHADYRLMSRKAVNFLQEFQEKNLYLRGIIPMIGLQTDKVYYKRLERLAGETKYPLRKMLSLAWEGITSMTVKPLRFVTSCGFIIFFLTVLFSIYAIYAYFRGNTVPGWASTVLPLYFLGGIQLLCVGLIGEYVAKIYKEVKARPRYFVDDILK